MKSNNKITGNIGENIGTEYLKQHGYEILEKNWRFSRFGEIDIIAKDKDTLVFVEVKTRKSIAFGHPFEAIDEKKIAQIKNIALEYIKQSNKKYKYYRIDGISVLLGKELKVEHIKNIF